jgi:subtilisin-like proprotein convertase family protein
MFSYHRDRFRMQSKHFEVTMMPTFLHNRGMCVRIVSALAALGIGASALGQAVRTNPAGVAINDNAAATPYPSTIAVSNLVGTLQKVTVTLSKVTHAYPDDINVLLVSPAGKKFVLMSAAGGDPDINGVDLTFDSGVATSLPDFAQITSGTYKPTSYKGEAINTVFPAPAPGGPYSLNLGDVLGDSPNGTWSLYVRDDQVGDAGSIASWSVNLFTTPTVEVPTNSFVVVTEAGKEVRTSEDIPVAVNIVVNDSSNDPGTLTLTAVSGNTDLVSTTNIVAGGSGQNRTLTITPNLNAFGTGTFTATVGDGISSVSTNLILVVAPVNDAPTIALSTNRIATAAGSLSNPADLLATLADVDSAPGSLLLSATSSNPSVVANSGVFFSNTADPLKKNISVAPTGAANGTATITVQVIDGAGGTNTAAFDVTVNTIPQAIFGNANSIRINSNSNAATLYPSEVVVSNVTGLIGKARVALANVTAPVPEDLNVLLVSPSGATNVLLMNAAGGDNALDRVRLTFEDAAATSLPNSAAITTGSYKPTGYDPTALPAPAPALEYGVDLSVLKNTDPNGTWRLYAANSPSGVSNVIDAGWVMTIYTAPTLTLSTNRLAVNEDTVGNITLTVGDFDDSITNLTVTATFPGGLIQSAVVSDSLAANRTLTVTPVANASGTATITITAKDKDNHEIQRTLAYEVAAVNDPPTVTPIAKQTTRAGIPVLGVEFTIDDVDNPIGALTVVATSSNQKLLPDSGIILGGSGNNRTISLYPIGNQAGTADVTVTVSDGSGGITTRVFSFVVEDPANPLYSEMTGISIRDNDKAEPYPSIIGVSNLVGRVAEVTVTLHTVNHARATNVNVLLVGPTTNVVLMSRAGAGASIDNATIVFSDLALASLPANGAIASGVYKPTTFTVPVFPADAPATHASTLAAFAAGTAQANGQWKLYVFGDPAGDPSLKGTIAGWSLSIRTAPVITTIPDQTTPEDVVKTVNVIVGDEQPGVTYTMTAVPAGVSGGPVILKTPIAISGQGATRTLTLEPLKDLSGTNRITVEVSDGVNSDSKSFLLVVTPVPDAPSISEIAAQTTTASIQTAAIPFTVSDPDTAPGSVTVTAESSNTTLVPNGNIFIQAGAISGNDRAYTISVLPAGVQTGSATITIRANDGGLTGQRSFVVNVLQGLAFANPAPISIRDNNSADPYPSTISVQNVGGTITRVTVTLLGFSHPYPEDVNVLLVSPNTNKVVLMTHAGGGNSASNLRLTFDADAATAVPDSTALANNATYRPAD